MRKRPLLRYFGGKFRIAHWIISNFPEHRIYIEPYGGGAGVLLQKEKSFSEIYNDLDDEIVNLFIVARDSGPKYDKLFDLRFWKKITRPALVDGAKKRIEVLWKNY